MRRFFRSPISRAASRFRARSKRRKMLRRHLTAAQSGDARQRAFRKRPRRSGGCASPVSAVFMNIPFSQTCRAASRFRARSKRREMLRRHLTAARSGDARQRAFRKRPRRSGGCASPVSAVFMNIPFSQTCRAASRFRARSKRREMLRRHLTAARSGDARQRAFRKRPRRGGGCASSIPAAFHKEATNDVAESTGAVASGFPIMGSLEPERSFRGGRIARICRIPAGALSTQKGGRTTRSPFSLSKNPQCALLCDKRRGKAGTAACGLRQPPPAWKGRRRRQ